MGNGLHLATLFGVKIRAHHSLLIIFLLVCFSLGAGVLPSWHPDWSTGLVWTVAVCAALLFFVSIVVHELSHALVAKALGLEVRTITLFLFGGAANIEREPRSPGGEALMAAVGPFASFVIAFLCMFGAAALSGADATFVDDPELAMQRMSPAVTLLAWLGPINFLLAVFNLLPGLPLDGGRILRAALWKLTGNLRQATQWASVCGRVLGGLLVITGVAMIFGVSVPVFGRGAIGGLWLALIGWFLAASATMSYRQLVIRELLEDVPVSRLMRRGGPTTVDAALPISALVEEYVMPSDERTFFASDGAEPWGIVRLKAIREVPRADWESTRVRDIAVPFSELSMARPDQDAFDVLQFLGRNNVDEQVVHDGIRAHGIIRRQDIARWLELQSVDAGNGGGMVSTGELGAR